MRWLVAGIMATSLMLNAAPIFPLPPGPSVIHPPGYVLHLPSPGPAPLLPGGTLGPVFFPDTLPSPDLHHWEVELHNPNPFVVAFNVSFATPAGAFMGGLSLTPGSSMLFDVMYPDFPAEVSPPLWMVTASSSIGMPAGIVVDTAILEYPFPTGAVPGIGATIAGGTPGAVFGPTVPMLPGIVLTVDPVPEPALATLLGLGALGLINRVKRRNGV